MDKRIDIFKLLESEGKIEKIILYPAIESDADPFEHNKTLSFLNPLTIKGMILPLSFDSLKWKFQGQLPVGSIKLICEVRYSGLLKLADKIKINDKYYKCYKDDSQGFVIIDREDYVVAILALKVE